ncbi:pyruvate dehydrogenase (acetyl-transferring) E1 component subunit alpha [Sulfolobus sp. A20]|uniref:thiamine pyrophosphate-dependent dehydrogenase E1 component subunit alpha n=2 Tax=Sulfolobaceae TaxID=118883 RepID=UPI000846084D|nr:thiamine pyrophosphate-dependent dehydrogenase E1 component subunit alpha [Sulfolobus sp. A20]TRM75138.1 thiamine pyrophosphate-dependent dehydrogenase E1 component subunit alpha [Sulfolobus sp. E5]TRM76687.1 thiamine pyrophosphate-dependent dehydrogenase E1 component subunit alpha [Sulfolobus sp. B5]TRM81568.1 thiamine pyrophosphate-dependent dehydrogenase E1 component subunit alpha [Sulfolobus sp. D5]TRM84661.1 thiamine pyrophosphate-dependent dehydrogenase E1 component subunit alpha [Sulf
MSISISKDKLLDMYRKMLLIRYHELTVKELFASGRIPGFVHLYVGEEAVAVGVMSNLKEEDYITSTHRGHGHCIAKGLDVKRMLAEILGKKTGVCKGKGGSMHIFDFSKGMLGANGIVGGGAPHAVGAALASKLKGLDRVAVAFIGDGAMNQGVVLESLNLATVWKLPVVFVVEDNMYAMSTRSLSPGRLQPRYSAAKSYVDRALGFGVPAVEVDGMDVLAVYEASREAINRARRGEGPSLLHCKTYRFFGHFEGDQLVYRDKEEEEMWKKRDPITLFKDKLISMKIATSEELDKIDLEAKQEISEALKFAEQSPYPELEEALTDVFTDNSY